MDKMEQIIYALKMFVKTPKVTTFYAVVTAFFSYLFAVEKPEMIFIIFLMIAIDFVSGITASIKEKSKITSNRGFGTIVKIVFYLGAIALANLVMRTCELYEFGMEVAVTISRLIVFFIMGLEAKSIVENFDRMGYKLPEKIKEMLLGLFNKTK